MKLFLCGGGSGEQIKYALNNYAASIDKSKPILYIPLAMEKEKYDSCKMWFASEIKQMGINNFEMISSSSELSKKNFDNYSSLFIGGGNTFKLLREIQENGNFEKINNYLKNDGIVFGGSAGAIIFGNNINSCLLDDENKVNLKNCDGFDYLNGYSILCHLNTQNFKTNFKYLREYSKKIRQFIYQKKIQLLYQTIK